jgi:hypothetical protein
MTRGCPERRFFCTPPSGVPVRFMSIERPGTAESRMLRAWQTQELKEPKQPPIEHRSGSVLSFQEWMVVSPGSDRKKQAKGKRAAFDVFSHNSREKTKSRTVLPHA